MCCFWILWSLMVWLSAILCAAGCLLPYWLKGTFEVIVAGESQLLVSHLGIFRRCVYPVYANHIPVQEFDNRTRSSNIRLQATCGHYDFEDIPHLTWKVGLIALGVACSLLFFITFFLFVIGFNLSLLAQTCVYKMCQFGLLVSGLLVMFTCVMFPIGWQKNEEVRQICGNRVDSFHIDKCHIGWAYVLTMAGGLLSLLATAIPCLFPMDRFTAFQGQRSRWLGKDSKSINSMTRDPEFQLSTTSTQAVLMTPQTSGWMPVTSPGYLLNSVVTPKLSMGSLSSRNTVNTEGVIGRPPIIYCSVPSTLKEDSSNEVGSGGGYVTGFLVPIEQTTPRHNESAVSVSSNEEKQIRPSPHNGQA